MALKIPALNELHRRENITTGTKSSRASKAMFTRENKQSYRLLIF